MERKNPNYDKLAVIEACDGEISPKGM